MLLNELRTAGEEYYQLHKNIEFTKEHSHKNIEEEWGPEM